jgi:hypothetical protein
MSYLSLKRQSALHVRVVQAEVAVTAAIEAVAVEVAVAAN